MEASFTVEQMLKTFRILLGALILGATMFLIMVVFVIGPGSSFEDVWFLFVGWAILAGVGAVGYGVARRVWTGQLRRRFEGRQMDPEEPLILRPYWTLSLAGAAITEGMTFYALVIHLLSGSRLALILALLGIAALLLQWPRAQRYQSFFERVTGQRPA